MKWEKVKKEREDRQVELKNVVMRKCRFVNWRARFVVEKLLRKVMELIDYKKAELAFQEKRAWSVAVLLHRLHWYICKRGSGRFKDGTVMIPKMTLQAFRGCQEVLVARGLAPPDTASYIRQSRERYGSEPSSGAAGHSRRPRHAVQYYHRRQIRHTLIVISNIALATGRLQTMAATRLRQFLSDTGEVYRMKAIFFNLQRRTLKLQGCYRRIKAERVMEAEHLYQLFDNKRACVMTYLQSCKGKRREEYYDEML